MAKIRFFTRIKNRHASFFDYASKHFENSPKQATDRQTCLSQIKTCKRLLGDMRFCEVNKIKLVDLNESLVAAGYSDVYIKSIFSSLKAVVNAAVKNGLLSQNPLINMRLLRGAKSKDVQGIENCSLNAIECLKCSQPSLKFVAKLFSFQCRTGLAYKDLVNVKYVELQKINDRYWLTGERSKTSNTYIIPLDKTCLSIIDIFRVNDSKLTFKKISDDYIFPFIRRGTYNAYLKKIGRITGIKEAEIISSHKARHTFAEHMLEKGVSVESIRKMLGHSPKSLVTWLYAKVTFQKLNVEVPKNY
jgi:site-specific recombinase XerD